VTDPKQRNFDAEDFLASAGLGRSIVQLKAREAFFCQGSEADSIFYLQRGRAEMLAGRPVKSVDEVLARVETILRNDAKVPAYTVVAAIRIHGSIAPEPKRKVLLLFPAV
jgi:hypothetical protein